eukprot:COSAG01_NODE_18241_length_1090_cov_1.461150_1_plen_157_part_10
MPGADPPRSVATEIEARRWDSALALLRPASPGGAAAVTVTTVMNTADTSTGQQQQLVHLAARQGAPRSLLAPLLALAPTAASVPTAHGNLAWELAAASRKQSQSLAQAGPDVVRGVGGAPLEVVELLLVQHLRNIGELVSRNDEQQQQQQQQEWEQG